MRKYILPVLFVAAALAGGCASHKTVADSIPSVPDLAPQPGAQSAPAGKPTALEGTWKGRDTTPGHDVEAVLILSGSNLEFRIPDNNGWVKGTFALRENVEPKQLAGMIKESSSEDLVGKKACAIYKLEDGKLTITGSQPGSEEFPSAFDAEGLSKYVLTKEK